MSGCLHLHEREKHVGWLCTGGSKRYIARARQHGFRNYELLGEWTRSKRKATRTLAHEMARPGTNYKRGDVLMAQPYYDPIVILEMVRP